MTDAKSTGRNSSRSKKTTGKRPPPPIQQKRIPTPEAFDKLVDSYVKLCHESHTPITLTGMILALGFRSKQGFYEYAKYPGYEECVSRAKLFIECELETRLHGANAAGAIFGLKNMGWMDITPEQLEKIRLEVQRLKNGLPIGDDDTQPAVVHIGVKDARRT
jgi:hypothetical protein